MNQIIKNISDDLAVNEHYLFDFLVKGKDRHRRFSIPKKKGGSRAIAQPVAELKMVQHWLLDRLFLKFPRSQISTAFHSGDSILKNAQIHAGSRYSIRIDLTNFFESIKLNDIKNKLFEYSGVLPNWATSDDLFWVVDNACFNASGSLPMGYPSSPILSNIAMLNLDNEIVRKISAEVSIFGACRLTRYADDFIFSTDKAGACVRFLDSLSELLSRTASPSLSVNEKKTKLMSRAGGSALFTGLKVTPDSRIKVHPNYRDHIRLMLKLSSANKLAAGEKSSLSGHLSYIEHVDPELFTRLSRKYFYEIQKIRGVENDLDATGK